MRKILIREQLEDNMNFAGDLNNLIKELSNYYVVYPNHKNLEIEDRGGYDDSRLCLYGERMETDKEFNKRKLKKEHEDKIKKDRSNQHYNYILEEAKKLKILE
jgi:hypothetical protein